MKVKIIKAAIIVLFLAAVPWALYYNLNYDRYGSLARESPPINIQIVTVGAGSFNNTLKIKAAQYAAANFGSRIYVLAMNADQIGAQEFDVRIIKDGDTFYAFISQSQSKEAISACEKFLEKIAQEVEGTKISIK